MNDAQRMARERIDELLVELTDLMGPASNDEDEDDRPDGPWMMTAWALAVDYAVEGRDGDVETWSVAMKSRGCPRAHAVGLGITIKDMLG